eukprot:6475790-Amphidinium_carterae.1
MVSRQITPEKLVQKRAAQSVDLRLIEFKYLRMKLNGPHQKNEQPTIQSTENAVICKVHPSSLQNWLGRCTKKKRLWICQTCCLAYELSFNPCRTSSVSQQSQLIYNARIAGKEHSELSHSQPYSGMPLRSTGPILSADVPNEADGTLPRMQQQFHASVTLQHCLPALTARSQQQLCPMANSAVSPEAIRQCCAHRGLKRSMRHGSRGISLVIPACHCKLQYALFAPPVCTNFRGVIRNGARSPVPQRRGMTLPKQIKELNHPLTTALALAIVLRLLYRDAATCAH